MFDSKIKGKSQGSSKPRATSRPFERRMGTPLSLSQPDSSDEQAAKAAAQRPESPHDDAASNIDIHTGPVADLMTRALNADALTVGGDILLDSTFWPPRSPAHHRLIAHERHHVQHGRPNVVYRSEKDVADALTLAKESLDPHAEFKQIVKRLSPDDRTALIDMAEALFYHPGISKQERANLEALFAELNTTVKLPRTLRPASTNSYPGREPNFPRTRATMHSTR